MLVPNRTSSSAAYRYGFQGQEKDDEIKGEGNSLNYTFRMHDPRVGRFFAVDPLESKFPHLTPFQFASNSPIAMIELEGLEGVVATGTPAPFSSSSRETGTVISAEQGREVAKKIIDNASNTHRRASGMMDFYEKNEHLLDFNEKLTFGKYQAYFFSWFHDYGSYTDAEDVSVIMDGRTIDGQEAGILDYSLAGVGAFIPFFSGGSVKKFFRTAPDEISKISIKNSDSNTILDIVSNGYTLDGTINFSDNAGVILDAKFSISSNGKELTLENIGFYQHKDGDILGAEGKNTLGNLPSEVLSQIKAQAKSEGFEKLILKYKRALYDDAKNMIGYGEDVIKPIKLD